MPVATDQPEELNCTSQAIRAKIRGGYIVECFSSDVWCRVGAVRLNEPGFKGLWVQELHGLKAWFVPTSARYRRNR